MYKRTYFKTSRQKENIRVCEADTKIVFCFYQMDNAQCWPNPSPPSEDNANTPARLLDSLTSALTTLMTCSAGLHWLAFPQSQKTSEKNSKFRFSTCYEAKKMKEHLSLVNNPEKGSGLVCFLLEIVVVY